jgi:hypothetical protein
MTRCVRGEDGIFVERWIEVDVDGMGPRMVCRLRREGVERRANTEALMNRACLARGNFPPINGCKSGTAQALRYGNRDLEPKDAVSFITSRTS